MALAQGQGAPLGPAPLGPAQYHIQTDQGKQISKKYTYNYNNLIHFFVKLFSIHSCCSIESEKSAIWNVSLGGCTINPKVKIKVF